jgi:hypothetical protein
MTPREAVGLECAFECLFDEAIEVLQPVADRPAILFH